MTTQRLMVAISWALVLTACGEDQTTAEKVSTRTNAVISDVVRATADSFATLSNLSTWQSLDRAMSHFDSAFAAVPSLAPTTSSGGSSGAPRQVDGTSSGNELDGDAAADALTSWLETHIFTERNLESSTDNSATFLLHGDAVCEPVTTCTWDSCWDQSDPTCFDQENVCTTAVDQGCIDGVDSAQIRIKATLVGEHGVDLVLMIGPDRDAPITLELRPQSIAVELDLAAAKAAAEYLASVSGSTLDLPRVMEGVIRLALVVNGEQDVTLSSSILEAIAIEVDGANGTTAVHAAASDPLFTLHLQGLLGRASVGLNAGALDVSTPYAEVTPSGTGTGTYAVHVAGASYSVVLDDTMQSLEITNVGLGDGSLTIMKDAVTLFALDLNPASGRHFNLNIVPTMSGDSAVFNVSPEFDLSLDFYLQEIAADFPDIEPYFYDNAYRITLSGNGGGAVMPIPPDGMGWNGGLMVVSGTLTVSSSSASSPVVVPEGQCLSGTDMPPQGSDPVLGHLVVSACP